MSRLWVDLGGQLLLAGGLDGGLDVAGVYAVCGQDFGFYARCSGWNPRRAVSGGAAGADVGDRPAPRPGT